jgi:phosphoglycolate phosphatase
MIGDRRMDIEGALHHGMRHVGVLWGFGGEEELRAAGARQLAQRPDELPLLLAA